MTAKLTELILNFNDSERHSIVHKLGDQMSDLLKGNEDQVMQIHQQYHSLIQQFYKPYSANSNIENVKVSMDKAYTQLKKDYKNE